MIYKENCKYLVKYVFLINLYKKYALFCAYKNKNIFRFKNITASLLN